MSKVVEFASEKQKIIDVIEKRKDVLEKLGINEPVSLIDGFITQTLSMKLSTELYVGESVIPMIILLGKSTGRIYFFALKALIDIEGY